MYTAKSKAAVSFALYLCWTYKELKYLEQLSNNGFIQEKLFPSQKRKCSAAAINCC